jgi:multidrug efflux system membrane fusion protein
VKPRVMFACVLCPLAAAACNPTQGAPSGRPQARPITVRSALVQSEDVVYAIKAVGSLEAEEVTQVTAEVEGAVSEVLFHEGDHVGPESVLLRIDPDRYRLEAARAEATYHKAVADAERAKADSDRREALATEKLVAPEELNRSRAETAQLGAEAQASKAAWDIALQNVGRSQVRPKRSGVINTRAVDTGRFVKVGDVLATLVDTSRLRLRFKVSEGESLRAREKDSIRFRVAPLGEQDFEARIYHVGGLADPGTRQVEVLAWVKNPGVLKPGFFAEVNLATETHQSALVVPEGAIQASERGFVVYVVKDDKAQLKQVKIGLRTGTGIVEILSGLQVGEIVVVEGNDRLADGAAVKAVTGGAGQPGAAAPAASR